MRRMQATARARANIALAKYWGKADDAHNLPAVPSVSITLDPLLTETRVCFDPKLERDAFMLGGAPASEAERARVTALLDRVRRESGVTAFAAVESSNRFPTASGLASSASGFAALATAARAAAGLPFDRDAISRLARSASVSAARSAFGGFVELPAKSATNANATDPAAVPIAPPEHWDVRVVVAVTDEGRKATGSSDGMRRTRETSPLYAAWVAAAPALAAEVRAGIVARDLARVGPAMERSTFAFHASALAASPPLLYMRPATLAALERVRALRDADGIAAWATMDAGPHVKVLCEARDAARVEAALAAVPGVLRTLVATPGPGVEVA